MVSSRFDNAIKKKTKTKNKQTNKKQTNKQKQNKKNSMKIFISNLQKSSIISIDYKETNMEFSISLLEWSFNLYTIKQKMSLVFEVAKLLNTSLQKLTQLLQIPSL